MEMIKGISELMGSNWIDCWIVTYTKEGPGRGRIRGRGRGRGRIRGRGRGRGRTRGRGRGRWTPEHPTHQHTDTSMAVSSSRLQSLPGLELLRARHSADAAMTSGICFVLYVSLMSW